MVPARTAAGGQGVPAPPDQRHERGPFDVVGDVHGCLSELVTLLGRLGYAVRRDAEGRPVGARHPEGRRAVFVGDLVDRGPDSPGVLRLVLGMAAGGDALCVPGNHDDKLRRALLGARVRRSHGLELTLDQFEALPAPEREALRRDVLAFLGALPPHLVLDGGRLVIAHAGLAEELQGLVSERARSFALYGLTTGALDENGFPVRLPWQNGYRGSATVLYGHVAAQEHDWVNDTLCLDTGCVFGGRLSALRWPERELIQVPAEQAWYPHPARWTAAIHARPEDARPIG